MEDGRWKMEDGRWKMEEIKSRVCAIKNVNTSERSTITGFFHPKS
jgi:hypothetical protein